MDIETKNKNIERIENIEVALNKMVDKHDELKIENLKLKEAIQEISECLEGFYDNGCPRRLFPELRKYAGYINVINEMCKNALKD